MILALLKSLCKGWQPEYRFHPKRQWRADFAHPGYKIIVEIEGGVFSNGRHVRGQGYLNDMEKYNAAVLLGWKILRYAPGQEPQMLEDVGKLAHENERTRPV
jgi:very-short-patch-repair endonuclease